MIKTNCSKCGADLILHDGYGVCSNCGEIIGFDIEEEPEEIVTEVLTPPETAEEVTEPEVFEETPEFVEEVTEEVISETEDVAEEQEETFVTETQEVAQEIKEIEETEESIEENVINDIPEEIDFPKRRKAPIIILIVVILCALAVLGGYFISEADWGTISTDGENVIPEEEVIEEAEEPKAINEEPEVVIEEPEEQIEEPEKVETTPAPAPVKQETPKKETVKKEDAVISPTPSISYRIRKSADDSTTQIGAFSDLERAKSFAASHAADGYKVFDMNGQLVFEP